MAYRNPRFYFHHAFRSAGVSALGGSTFTTANPRAYVHDSGLGRLGTFNAAAANQYVKADRGASFAALPQPDRLIIPPGHTLNGCTVQVRHNATDPGSGLVGALNGSVAVTGSALIMLTLSPVVSDQYTLVNCSTSGAWSFAELWLSVLRTTTRGPAPEWKDSKVANQFEAQMRSGETYRLELGAERRFFEFTYRALSGADLLVFTDMRTETRNGLYPLYVDPPDDGESAVLMQLVGGLEFAQDFPVPTSGAQYTVTLRLLEVLA